MFIGNTGIGTRGRWGAKAVLKACRKMVERPNSGKPTNRLPGKVLKEEADMVSQQRWGTCKQLVMFFGNTGIGMNSPQPIEEELDRSEPTRPECWKPQPGQVQDPLLRSAWSQHCEAPVRNPMWCLYQATPGINGKWVNRDCNVAHWGQQVAPTELCRWPHRARLPAKGKEYHGLGVKKLRDRAPKPRPSSL
ncbi:hypothetical protein QJQ45_001233 [Haematococcus lacustris]|nr:hypothetical protein QJQ45_001233 [Haematococcus lacustris]